MNVARALITGGTSGLGKALATHLASQGIPLIISGRRADELAELSQTLPTHVVCETADLSYPSERKALLERIKELKPDLVINNAGFGLYGDVLDHKREEELAILELNSAALLEITIEAAKALREANKQGTILNISSAAAFFATPGFAVYAASKMFVNQFSLAFDREMAPHGIRILTACPGQIATDFRRRAASGHPQKKDDLMTMSVEKAVKEIVWQIEKQKRLHIFDLRYQVSTFLARHFVPESFIGWIIQRSVKKRIRSS